MQPPLPPVSFTTAPFLNVVDGSEIVVIKP